MARFTASEATRIVADNGTKCANFEAGETLSIHKDLFAPAIRAGLVPEEPLKEADVPKPPHRELRTRQEIIDEELLAACRELISKGNPNDFTRLGQPRVSSVKKLVNSENFTAKDAQRAFEQAMFEVSQDGHDDTEHTQSSSSNPE